MSAGQNRQPLPHKPWKHPSVSWPCWIFNMSEELKILMEWKQSSEMFNLPVWKWDTILVFLKGYQKKIKVRKNMRNHRGFVILWILPFGPPMRPCLPSLSGNDTMKQKKCGFKETKWQQSYISNYVTISCSKLLIKAQPISIHDRSGTHPASRGGLRFGACDPPPPLLNTGTGKALWLLSKGTSKSDYARSYA